MVQTHNKFVSDVKTEREYLYDDERLSNNPHEVYSSEEPEIKEKYKDILKYLPRLPKIEQEFIRLYYFENMSEPDIARKFNMNQSGVNYRKTRAFKRLRYLVKFCEMQEFTDKDIDDLLSLWLGEIDRSIIKLMLRTTSYTATAKELEAAYPFLKITYTIVHNRFQKAIKVAAWLREEGSETMSKLHGVLTYVKKHIGFLHSYTHESKR